MINRKFILFIKLVSTIVLLLVGLISNAQSVKIFNENKTDGYVLYASNDELYPVSILLNLSLNNLNFSEGKQTQFVIPAQSSKFKIGELTIVKRVGKTQFSMKSSITMGDVTVTDYDKNFVYDLPFQQGKSFVLSQGYNGKFSHKNENALDFTMPEGTDVLAARDGKIVEIVQHNSISCPTSKCNEYNNYVTIMHSDGTFSSYIHIQKNSVKFNLGDEVKRGDIIAKSGNVGWSNGPHLHFECFIGAFGARKKLVTLFKVNSSEKGELLQEGKTYMRNY